MSTSHLLDGWLASSHPDTYTRVENGVTAVVGPSDVPAYGAWMAETHSSPTQQPPSHWTVTYHDELEDAVIAAESRMDATRAPGTEPDAFEIALGNESVEVVVLLQTRYDTLITERDMLRDTLREIMTMLDETEHQRGTRPLPEWEDYSRHDDRRELLHRLQNPDHDDCDRCNPGEPGA